MGGDIKWHKLEIMLEVMLKAILEVDQMLNLKLEVMQEAILDVISKKDI